MMREMRNMVLRRLLFVVVFVVTALITLQVVGGTDFVLNTR